MAQCLHRTGILLSEEITDFFKLRRKNPVFLKTIIRKKKHFSYFLDVLYICNLRTYKSGQSMVLFVGISYRSSKFNVVMN